MKRVYSYILQLSPKVLAIYLIVCPLLALTFYVILFLIVSEHQSIYQANNKLSQVLFVIINMLFILVFLLWILWLKATTLSVDTTKLGIPIKWFNIVFGLFLFYLIYNLTYEPLYTFLSTSYDNYTWLLYGTRETINFIGLLILYPAICHYSARAISAKRYNSSATTSNSILNTILLICFPVCIPFFQKYFSPIQTKKSTLIKIYALGFGVLILLTIITFIGAITNSL
ncbi:hypothetical protein [Winogradskyella endarachnes]|uniref:Uncharacterized protein n=1 Tax=Winogradskyella endarachnes TaxID=2681965 RepID=A0A6L6U7U5_9FLAO|nr:hypothetical protein [Winogradskyella endarachnes]MUU78401.1 hypothetical protein [Winogradskyella endarachnes]